MHLDSDHFRSEVIWKRGTAHCDVRQGRRQYGGINHVLLFYTKGQVWTSNPEHSAYEDSYAKKYSSLESETGRRYMLHNMEGPGGASKGNPTTRSWA